jgi:hypothetical protein
MKPLYLFPRKMCQGTSNRIEAEGWVSICPSTVTIIDLLHILLQLSYQKSCIQNKLQKFVDYDLMIITRLSKWAPK